MQSGIPAFCAHRESMGIGGNWWELEGIPGHSWSFLPIPELQTSHGWPDDHLLSLKKCQAEFLHLVHIGNWWELVGIGRNSWSFLPIPELQTSHGWPDDHLQSLKKCKAEFLHFCKSGITKTCRNNWSFRVIPEFFIYAHFTYIHAASLI